ncbi:MULTISPECIES: hypothetical protein [Streptomyces]|uniref:hypothetical protein n=1 Tax=Streptomyces TaxID=1883 RepID=UPI0004BDE2F5|nr:MULTISPECIES: hypothetical protein [Streptomyces]QHF92680.1 hypothetical protein DEH18_00760 [Streptomyces sp. NHF165]
MPEAQEPVDARESARPPSSVHDARQQVTDAERLRRRARFLRELNEARQLRERVRPRRAREARMRRQALLMRTFRW